MVGLTARVVLGSGTLTPTLTPTLTLLLPMPVSGHLTALLRLPPLSDLLELSDGDLTYHLGMTPLQAGCRQKMPPCWIGATQARWALCCLVWLPCLVHGTSSLLAPAIIVHLHTSLRQIRKLRGALAQLGVPTTAVGATPAAAPPGPAGAAPSSAAAPDSSTATAAATAAAAAAAAAAAVAAVQAAAAPAAPAASPRSLAPAAAEHPAACFEAADLARYSQLQEKIAQLQAMDVSRGRDGRKACALAASCWARVVLHASSVAGPPCQHRGSAPVSQRASCLLPASATPLAPLPSAGGLQACRRAGVCWASAASTAGSAGGGASHPGRAGCQGQGGACTCLEGARAVAEVPHRAGQVEKEVDGPDSAGAAVCGWRNVRLPVQGQG